ncbi:MAG: hypothetical protein QOK05_2966 [Chloroflexota bacterium]|nr:hypothetical protein [Chloroflexota bacterium]
MLARAVVLLLLTRVSLWVRPFAAVRTALDRYGRRQGRVGQVPVHAVVWAVNAGSAVVPGSTCLTRALVAQALLRNVGHDSQLRLGVASDVSRGFEAHAWLEDGAGILIGAESAAGFTVLPDIDGR